MATFCLLRVIHTSVSAKFTTTFRQVSYRLPPNFLPPSALLLFPSSAPNPRHCISKEEAGTDNSWPYFVVTWLFRSPQRKVSICFLRFLCAVMECNNRATLGCDSLLASHPNISNNPPANPTQAVNFVFAFLVARKWWHDELDKDRVVAPPALVLSCRFRPQRLGLTMFFKICFRFSC